MQAVLDGEILEVAQPGIDAAQHLVGRSSPASTPASPREAAAPRGLDDQAGQALAAAAVEPVGLGVFVDQPLERARHRPTSPVATSGGGRWPMVTAAMRRLACAASPGLLTMKG